MITNVEKIEFTDTLEIRCYERGMWQHDSYVNELEDAIERMNFLCQKYDFREDEVEVVRLTYYKNIIKK